MGHVQRIALSATFIFAVFVLGIVIDSAVFELLGIMDDFGVHEGPFSVVPGHVEGVATLVVPMFLLGIALWIIWGSIQEERQEEQQQRVRRVR